MKTATALILEPSDLTKDGNIKKEAFEAFIRADLVIRDGVVIKGGPVLAPSAPQEPVKRVRRPRVAKPTPDAPQATTEPNTAQPDFTGHEPPSFGDVSADS